MISKTKEQIEERINELKELVEEIEKKQLDKEDYLGINEEYSLEYTDNNYDVLEVEDIKEDILYSIEKEIEELETDLEVFY